MARIKEVNFAPGVVKDDSELDAARKRGRRRWVDSDRIRFVAGIPQKIGGWAQYNSTAFLGYCRGLLDWQSNASVAHLGIGTHLKLYALVSTTYNNITPTRTTGTLTNPFATTNSSATVTVTHSAHGGVAGDYVEFSDADAVGGITIDGNYAIVTAANNSYTITHSSSATSTTTGGGTVSYEYEIHTGLADGSQGTGYGVGPYGEEEYGDARTNVYLLLPPRTWSIDRWGEYMVACPRDGNIYEWQLNTGTRAQLLSNAPTTNIGMFVTDEKHIVALGAGGEKMVVDWCDQDDNTIWTADSTNTAGSRKLTGGSEILFGLRARGTNMIFTDSAVWTMTFVGGLDVMGFAQVAGGSSGVISPHGGCELDGIVYWMGRNDFYMYDGVVRRIPNSKDIRRFVFDNMTQLQRDKVYCGLNTLFSEVWWVYTTSTEINRYVKYNYDDRAWDVGTITRTALIDRGVFDNPLMAGTDNIMYQHESGVDDVQTSTTAAMNESLTSAPFDIGDGNNIAEIISIIPDFQTLTGTITLALLTRYYPHGTQSTESSSSVTSASETIDTRASGRQAALKISSSSTGTDWRYGNTRFEILMGGER